MRAKTAPKSVAQKFRLGDPVWVLRSLPMGTHCIKTWLKPGEVVCKTGEDTYGIKVGPGHFREQQESQLCAVVPDVRGKHVSLDYTTHEAESDDDYAEQDSYTVQKFPALRQSASALGGVEFKVRWGGFGPSYDTWEPVFSFVRQIITPFMEYVRRHKTKMQVSESEALTRAIEARGN